MMSVDCDVQAEVKPGCIEGFPARLWLIGGAQHGFSRRVLWKHVSEPVPPVPSVSD